MKKILFSVLLALLSVPRLVGADVRNPPSTIVSGTLSGTTTVSGRLTSTYACATNYLLSSPSFCQRVTSSLTLLSRDTCVSIPLPSTEAKAIYGAVSIQINTQNATGLRNCQVITYSDSGCTTNIIRNARLDLYEFVATATTSMGQTFTHMIVPVPASGTIYMQMTDDAGNSCTASWQMNGYFRN